MTMQLAKQLRGAAGATSDGSGSWMRIEVIAAVFTVDSSK
jgi:hypothetical protein